MTVILGIAAYGLLCTAVGWGLRSARARYLAERYEPEPEPVGDYWDDDEGYILSVRDDPEYQAAMAGVHEDTTPPEQADTAGMHLTCLDTGSIADTVRACEVMDYETEAFLSKMTAEFEAIHASFVAGAR